MSLIPEYIIQQVLVDGINRIRQDRRILDAIFRNLRQVDLQSIWDYVRDNTIDIAINYPDEGLKLPSVVILLRTENESEEFLGDLMQPAESLASLGIPFPQGADKGSTTSVGVPAARVLMSEVRATGGTTNTLTVQVSTMPLFDPFEEDSYVVTTRGTGAGQRRKILSVSPVQGADTIVQVTTSWDVVPDDTTYFKVVGEDFPIVGEPSKVFKPTDVVERLGAHYQAQYQLVVMAENPELVIYLYMIIKGIFFLSTETWIRNGFLNIKLSGTDFIPRSEYLPDRAYQRSLMVDFHYSFDVFSLNEFGPGDTHGQHWTQLGQIKSSIDVHDPDVRDVNDPERIVLETTLDLVEP